MGHPYRHCDAPTPHAAEPLDDERDLAIVLAAIGLVPVILTIAANERFGAEPTIGLGLLALAAVTAWRRR
ncbi:MAG: hypothetical protein IPL61_34360 [Myxococcales bacterium]|nr:hypothetical protein [Myxococcales bacterium]